MSYPALAGARAGIKTSTDKPNMNHHIFHQLIDALSNSNALRSLQSYQSNGAFIDLNGQRLLNLTSNNYLGIANNHQIESAFLTDILDSSTNNKTDRLFGATGSRLLSGNLKAFEILENQIAGLYQREACLTFNSGYHANLGILPALADKKDLIFADKLAHASIIDGIRLCDAEFMRYPHLDYQYIDDYLKKNRTKYQNVIIVSESIFSMYGDCADIDALVELKQRHDALLYIDEAHAVGARGKSGRGIAEESNHIKDIDFIVGTFGKAIASVGAYIVCDKIIRDVLINKCRPFIFSTALPAINALWTSYILNLLPVLDENRKKLSTLHTTLRTGLFKAGVQTGGSSQIVPVLCGSNEKAIALAAHLQSNNYYCLPIRSPTVPRGSERVRLSLCADMELSSIENLTTCIADFFRSDRL